MPAASHQPARRLFCRGAACALGSTAWTGLGHAADTAAATAAAAEPPDLAARFQVSLRGRDGRTQVQQWQLSRSASEIGWLKGSATEELWRRDRSGIRLQRVLRAERHVIDYPAGELRALQVALDWPVLGSLFAEANLPLLKLQPAGRAGPLRHYRGRLAGDWVDLWWDSQARLPQRLLRRSAHGQVLYQRLALHAQAPADWPRVGAGTQDFAHLDAADFGDMAYHPVVRKAQAQDQRAGWRPAHGH